MVTRVTSRAMRRGGVALISLVVTADMPSSFRPCFWAAMPMMVSTQADSAVATRSVGEKDSPLPWLSVGASVISVVPLGPWVALQRRLPS